LEFQDTRPYNAGLRPSNRNLSLEDAVREAFYGIAISTFAHRYASVVELREPSDVIIPAAAKIN